MTDKSLGIRQYNMIPRPSCRMLFYAIDLVAIFRLGQRGKALPQEWR